MHLFRWALVAIAVPLFLLANAQCDRWQQRIGCEMNVELDVRAHTFSGHQRLRYTNNSPDTLSRMYFHLYFNAFKPGSEMDVRSRTIADPDQRVGDRIASLAPEQQGDLRCMNMLQDGRVVRMEPMGTVLLIHLARPLLPGKSTTVELDFQGQVPLQIRRSGRDSQEGIAYSMTQWFPKVAAYDHQGWHADPYVAREFYGEWGDYDVRITLDSSYTVAASGVLVNANEIGHGYASPLKRRASGRLLTWHFKAPNVHDFAWAADPHYKHITAQVPGGPLLHFFYQNEPELEAVWKDLPAYMIRNFEYMSKHFGAYPYPDFSFAQGGDGGMEYPNLTLITGRRKLGSLVGTSVHESIHNWYYGMLASDEGSYPWMDEGFTEYAGAEVMQALFPGSLQGRAHSDAMAAYLQMAESDDHEPMSTHADHFNTNRGYGTTAYSKGEFFLDQLGAVVGDSMVHAGLLRYYKACRFKHPEPVDVQRSMEKASGLQLDWYFDEWINSTRELDYAVKSVLQRNDSTFITLERKGGMIMPIDVEVDLAAGDPQVYNIPLSLMLGRRQGQGNSRSLPAWQWTDPTYTFGLAVPLSAVASVTLDPLSRIADSDRSNDKIILGPGIQGVIVR